MARCHPARNCVRNRLEWEKKSSREWFRSTDLRVMSPAPILSQNFLEYLRYHCATLLEACVPGWISNLKNTLSVHRTRNFTRETKLDHVKPISAHSRADFDGACNRKRLCNRVKYPFQLRLLSLDIC